MNIDKPLVSVIIPTYNVEPFLLGCLDSINAQSYSYFECIIIIDGATDYSYELAKDYCSKHEKFKVFYQDNAGSGPARNLGIAQSTGDFICFVDPDDWVEKNYISSLIEKQLTNNYDLVVSQSIDHYFNLRYKEIGSNNNVKKIVDYLNQKECRENFPALMFEYHLLDGPICKLYKTAIIKDNHIEFPPYRRSQDIVFNFRYYNYIQSICVIPVFTYNVRIETTKPINRGRIFTGYNEIVVKIYKELSTQLESWHINVNYDTAFYSWCYWFLYFYISRSVVTKTPYKYIEQEPYKTIIRNARPKLRHHNVIRICIQYRLYSIANFLIRIIDRLKNDKNRTK